MGEGVVDGSGMEPPLEVVETGTTQSALPAYQECMGPLERGQGRMFKGKGPGCIFCKSPLSEGQEYGIMISVIFHKGDTGGGEWWAGRRFPRS